ncbi:unnamed protein product [Choristocarpus tenellus]
MSQAIPSKILSTGAKLPVVGLGTWLATDGAVGPAVKEALRAGYRHIDCASNYFNEHEVGQALAESIQEGVVKREDVFITSKLNNPYHRREHVRPHLLKTLKDLGVDSLDLWLMHWPIAFKHVPFDVDKTGEDAYLPGNPDDSGDGANIDRGVSIRETWEAMEACYDEGLVKAIGVANFNFGLLYDILSYARVKPAVNQVESHPYLQQNGLLSWQEKEGIVFEGYSPLGSGGFVEDSEPRVLDDPVLKRIGDKHGRSPAAVCIRWAVQRGTVTLPKSVTPSRIVENLASVHEWELDEVDMDDIRALDRNYHYLRPIDWYGVPLFTP